MINKIKILVIEDNKLLREGIVAILKKQSDMKVFASVGNNDKLLDLIHKEKISVLLLDLGLRNNHSLNIVKLIKTHTPEVKIIIMDLIPQEKDVFDFVQAGVSGFILKDADVQDFYNTIRSVHKGDQILPPILTNTLFSQIIEHAVSDQDPSKIIQSVRMTKREKEVIELIAEGFTNKEIAHKLHISSYTVKSHVHNILEKLSLSSRVQVAKYAYLSDTLSSQLKNTTLIDE